MAVVAQWENGSIAVVRSMARIPVAARSYGLNICGGTYRDELGLSKEVYNS